MGKPTGFLDFDRENNKSVKPLERIKNFNEFHSPMQKAERQNQGARCMNCGVPFCQSAMKLGGMVESAEAIPSGHEWYQAVLFITLYQNGTTKFIMATGSTL